MSERVCDVRQQGCKAETTVVIPGSATDIVKAIRELIAMLNDVGKLVGNGADLYDEHRSRRAARNIDAISFGPTGSRRFLERIVAGTGTKEDIQLIGDQMIVTAREVEKRILALGKFRNSVREKHGMEVANQLRELIYGPAGKLALRSSLSKIKRMGKREPLPLDNIRSEADQALLKIEEFNRQLVEFHDLILPPKSKS